MFYIKVPGLNLDKTYSTGQSLNWYKLRDGKYFVVDGNKSVTVEQGHKDMLSLSCTEDEFYEHWYYYFDINRDYVERFYTVKMYSDTFKRIAVRGNGIRVLRMGTLDTMFQNVFIQNFKTQVRAEQWYRRFREFMGSKKDTTARGSGKITWYVLPGNFDMIENFDNVVKKFKKYCKENNVYECDVKLVIKSLKMIKSLLTNYGDVWVDISNKAVSDVLKRSKLNKVSIQKILINGFGRHSMFAIEDITEKAVKNFDDEWEEYEDATDLANQMFDKKKYRKMAAYIKLLIEWDYINPPRLGDSVLWA